MPVVEAVHRLEVEVVHMLGAEEVHMLVAEVHMTEAEARMLVEADYSLAWGNDMLSSLQIFPPEWLR
jgi:hypothetical protein